MGFNGNSMFWDLNVNMCVFAFVRLPGCDQIQSMGAIKPLRAKHKTSNVPLFGCVACRERILLLGNRKPQL